MTKITRETYPGISKEERKKMFEKLDYSLRTNKQTGKLSPVKKRQTKKK